MYYRTYILNSGSDYDDTHLSYEALREIRLQMSTGEYNTHVARLGAVRGNDKVLDFNPQKGEFEEVLASECCPTLMELSPPYLVEGNVYSLHAWHMYLTYHNKLGQSRLKEKASARKEAQVRERMRNNRKIVSELKKDKGKN